MAGKTFSVAFFFALLLPGISEAGQKVNLLILGDLSSDYVRGVQPGTQYGNGIGISLGIPSCASGLFKIKGSQGGASGSLGINLDFGLEAGIFFAGEYSNYQSAALNYKVVRVPALFWLQVNKNVWFGVGGHLTQFQQPVPSGFGQQYMGLVSGLRFNLWASSETGLALEARYLYGLTNAAAVTSNQISVDGVEALIGLRFGKI